MGREGRAEPGKGATLAEAFRRALGGRRLADGDTFRLAYEQDDGEGPWIMERTGSRTEEGPGRGAEGG